MGAVRFLSRWIRGQSEAKQNDALLRYPPYHKPFLSWFAGVYDAVFIAFHPFIRLNPKCAPDVHDYPEVETIRDAGHPVAWQDGISATDLSGNAQLCIALLSTIGALHPKSQDQPAKEALRVYLEREAVWQPDEGYFPTLLEPALLAAFELAKESRVVNLNEFGDMRTKLSLAKLRASRSRFDDLECYAASFFPPSRRFLVTTDWDSFFTLFCGDREFLSRLVEMTQMEGFFCDARTRHTWPFDGD